MSEKDLRKEYEAVLFSTRNPMYACPFFDSCSVNRCLLDNSLGKKVIFKEDPDKVCLLNKKHRKSYIIKFKRGVLDRLSKAHEQKVRLFKEKEVPEQ